MEWFQKVFWFKERLTCVQIKIYSFGIFQKTFHIHPNPFPYTKNLFGRFWGLSILIFVQVVVIQVNIRYDKFLEYKVWGPKNLWGTKLS